MGRPSLAYEGTYEFTNTGISGALEPARRFLGESILNL
jgi:hypothetical protein